MKKFLLGIGVFLGFSFAAVAATEIVGKTVTIPQGNRVRGGSICDGVADNLVSNCGFELSAACPVSDPGCPSGLSERLVQRSCDAPRGIGVGPPDRLGGLVVLLDVSHQRPLAAL